MIEFKTFRFKKQVGSFRFLIQRLRDGKVTATALCRHEREVERTINRFKGVK